MIAENGATANDGTQGIAAHNNAAQGDQADQITPAIQAAQSDAHINRIAVRPAPFYRKAPDVWFRQLESQFILAGVTSAATKFHYALASLPEDIACDITVTGDSYDALKTAVIEMLRANRHQRIEEALAAVELGDRRPTQLVSDIRRRFSEVGLQVDDSIVKSRLLMALPSNIRSALVGHESASLDNFAKIADSMLAVASPSTPFNTVARVNAMPSTKASSSTPVSRLPRHARQSKQKVCNGHIYYGTEARTCRPWCQWPGPKPQRVLHSRQVTPTQSRAASPTNE